MLMHYSPSALPVPRSLARTELAELTGVTSPPMVRPQPQRLGDFCALPAHLA